MSTWSQLYVRFRPFLSFLSQVLYPACWGLIGGALAFMLLFWNRPFETSRVVTVRELRVIDEKGHLAANLYGLGLGNRFELYGRDKNSKVSLEIDQHSGLAEIRACYGPHDQCVSLSHDDDGPNLRLFTDFPTFDAPRTLHLATYPCLRLMEESEFGRRRLLNLDAECEARQGARSRR